MPKFRKKPVVIEAIQWYDWSDLDIDTFKAPQWSAKCEHCGYTLAEHGEIPTLEGRHIVCPGDWIITGIKGEKYPCKPDIFEATYEPVEEPK